MRSRLILATFLAISALAINLTVRGDDRPAAAPDKSRIIRDLLHGRSRPELVSFVTEDGTELYRPPDWVAWCEQFNVDFQEQRGIEHVAPVAQSQRYDDPVFRPWQDRCPLLAFNARSVWRIPPQTPSGPRGDWVRRLPPHMPDGRWLDNYQYGTRDFQLFIGDFDNDPHDYGGEEVIFFSDAFYSYWELIARDERLPLALPPVDRNWNDVMPPDKVPAGLFIDISAEYRFLDLDKCLSSKLEEVSSPYYTWGRIRKRPEAQGLIKYRNQYYIYQLGAGVSREAVAYDLDIEALKPQREPTRGQPVDVEGPPYCHFYPG